MADFDDVVEAIDRGFESIGAKLDDIRSAIRITGFGPSGGGSGALSEAEQAEAGGASSSGGSSLGVLGKAAAGLAAGRGAQRLLDAGVTSAITSGGDASSIRGGLLREALGLAANIPGLSGAVDQIRGPYDQAEQELKGYATQRAALGNPLSPKQLEGQFDLSLARAKRSQSASNSVSSIASRRFEEDQKQNAQIGVDVLNTLAQVGALGSEVQKLRQAFETLRITMKAGGF